MPRSFSFASVATRFLRVRDDHAFGDLEVEVLRREAARAQRLLDDGEAAVVLQLLHREVDGKAQHHAEPMPRDHLPARVAQHARAERLDHPRFLGDRDELGRRNHAAHRIAPAQQRFDGAGAAGLQVDLRLVGEEEFVLQQSAPHVGLELQPRLHPRIHVGRVEAVRVAADFLRRVHRGVRLLDQRHGVAGVEREHRNADRAGQRGRLVGEPERRQERFADARQHGHRLEGRMRRVELRAGSRRTRRRRAARRCRIRARRP